MDGAALRQTLYTAQPDACETLAGYAVYATDATPEARPAAETLPERTLLKSRRDEAAVSGHTYSGLVRWGLPGRAGCAPQAVERITSDTTGNQVAAEQVQRLDQQSARPQVGVAASG